MSGGRWLNKRRRRRVQINKPRILADPEQGNIFKAGRNCVNYGT
jgi:hypothetical protein